MGRAMNEISKEEKKRVRSYTKYLINKGKIIKPTTCSECGKSGIRIYPHHKDYSKPLDIEWLCLKCHCRLHDLGKFGKEYWFKKGVMNIGSKPAIPIMQFTKDGKFVRSWKSQADALRWLGKATKGQLSLSLRGMRKTQYGYVWKSLTQ